MSSAPFVDDARKLDRDDAADLLAVVEGMSRARDLASVMAVVRQAARRMMKADGATFVLREGEQVFYADEDAISPLWKGRRFPASACVSGWAMQHREAVAIRDIYADVRVPVEAYRPTFVKSLLMMPIRIEDPIGAIGAYWAHNHLATADEIKLLQSLAGFAAIAVANAELNQQAQDAIAARDRWLGIASHELKTPLTPVRVMIQGVIRGLQADRPRADLVSRLGRAITGIDRLRTLVDRLLEYSRFSSQGVELAREPVDLSRLAHDVSEQLRPAAEEAGSQIVIQAAGRVEGAWDRPLLEEVCANLISNAVKYGAGRPIVVETGLIGSRARLTVRDQGTGIAIEHQERIFHPFSRLDENGHGVGLGLWIVRQIVRAHGGAVSVTSAPGGGTAMSVELPIDAG